MTKKNRTWILRTVLIIGTIVSLYFVPWPIVKAWLTPLPDSIKEQVNKAADYGFDGIIVYVDTKGEMPEYYTSGYQNKESKSPVDPNSLFKIASIDKLYTAVAVTKLVDSGQLSLDNTLAAYYPELEDRIENADRITIRMLVKHRSGIPNFTNTENFWMNPPENSQQALERILDLPAEFDPDEEYEYSNTNYLLLSNLIEKVTGSSKFDYIKDEILDPLGLKNTFGSLNDVDIDRVLSGYYVGVKEDIKTTNYRSMLATAEDVGIFLRALNDGSLFYGEEQEIYSSLYKYNHTGLIPGYQSIARYHKDIDTVIIQFTNTTNFEGYNWNLSEVMYNRILKIVRKYI
ncbi:serine hydrolase domain-containing protein [Christiangramia echinicola]|uniref:serine hydrolase domain-containing protein n=1 Tax=Christiangramia echinicola TaxID=279359 RepID=UPI0003F6136A|nr:serine hydrolase domain-containing protein [Christiangramia echinicola]